MSIETISGQAVFPDGIRPARISFDSTAGTITKVENTEHCDDGRLIFPGFVDIHVHAREYSRPSEPGSVDAWERACRKETFETAGLAALNGGVTAFCAMPNDPVPPADDATYRAKMLLTADSPCPVVLYAAVTKNSEPWADIPYKVYLDTAPSGVSFSEWSYLETALARYKGCRVFFHAEDPDILREHGGKGPRWLTRPREAEIRAVEKILDLTAKLGLRSHICHVSTEDAVRLIEEYNSTCEDKITCEATPHHLFFSVEQGTVLGPDGMRPEQDWLMECNPPLRSEADRRFMLEALRQGMVQVLASDHAPHTIEDKRKGAPGMPHLDTLGAFSGWLMRTCGFSPERIAEVLSGAPSRVFSRDLVPLQGSLEPGYAASFTIQDLNRFTVVEKDTIRRRGPLKTRCGWTPFAGMTFPAGVDSVWVRGKEYPHP